MDKTPSNKNQHARRLHGWNFIKEATVGVCLPRPQRPLSGQGRGVKVGLGGHCCIHEIGTALQISWLV